MWGLVEKEKRQLGSLLNAVMDLKGCSFIGASIIRAYDAGGGGREAGWGGGVPL